MKKILSVFISSFVIVIASFSANAVKVVESLAVDKVAEMYIMGSEIDYVQEIMGSFLKINNPLTKSSCGCGESFSV